MQNNFHLKVGEKHDNYIKVTAFYDTKFYTWTKLH